MNTRTPAVLLAILLVPHAAAFSSGEPIETQGEVRITDAAWVYFISASTAYVDVEAWRSETLQATTTSVRSDLLNADRLASPPQDAGNDSGGPTTMALSMHSHGRIFLQGNLDVHAAGEARLVPLSGSLPWGHFPPAEAPHPYANTLWMDRWDADAIAIVSATSFLISGAVAGFSATNTSIACSGTSCPRSPTNDLAFSTPHTKTYRVMRTSLEGDGVVHVSGGRGWLVIGLAAHDVQLSGFTTFPSFQDGSLCPSCTGSEAFRFHGELTLNGVQGAPGQGMRGQVTLGGGTAFVDEQMAAASALDMQTPLAVGVVVATAAAFTWKIALSLVSAYGIRQPLANARRQTLMRAITDKPGATFRELVRATGIPAGTARHHLTILKRSGLIVEHGHRSTRRFFENHGKFETTWRQVVALREPELKAVHDWLRDRPGWRSQKEVIAGMAQAGWSRSTTQHRLARLVAHGAVVLREQGRLKMYSPASGPDSTRLGSASPLGLRGRAGQPPGALGPASASAIAAPAAAGPLRGTA